MLEQQIKDLITGSLPQLQAQTLQEELVRLYDIEKNFKVLTDDFNALEVQNKNLRSRESQYRYLQDDKQQLKKDQERLEKDRLALAYEVKLNDQYATFCSSRVTDHKHMMEIVFKNPVLKTSVLESTSREVVTHPDNPYPQTSFCSDLVDTTTTNKTE